MSNAFDLASLIPEPLTFKDIDGTIYPARSTAEFGAIDYAAYMRLERQVASVQVVLINKRTDDDERQRAAVLLEQSVNELCGLITPTLPSERMQVIPFGFKVKFLEWWRKQAEAEAAAEGKPTGRD